MSDGAAPKTGLWRRILLAWANGWLRILFWHTAHAPWAPRLTKPFFLFFTWRTSPDTRAGTLANARWLLGPSSTRADRVALGKAVVSSFYDMVVEFGSNERRSTQQILARLESVEGEEHYLAARAARRGAILVTAHLGSFETAMTMLATREPRGGIHAVFKRDLIPIFERLRTRQHQRLGIVQAAVDDGLPVWVRLRDALLANQVVLMQGDRIMSGQQGLAVPFLGGHIRLPAGPVKLAEATGAPIIPTFAIQTGRGDRVRIVIRPPIWVDPADATPRGRPPPALLAIASAIEEQVSRYPQQWLCLHKVWIQDTEPASSRPPDP